MKKLLVYLIASGLVLSACTTESVAPEVIYDSNRVLLGQEFAGAGDASVSIREPINSIRSHDWLSNGQCSFVVAWCCASNGTLRRL